MKHLFRSGTLVIILLVFAWSSRAQILSSRDNDIKLASLPYYSFGKGVGLTSPDSLFQFNVRFRIQNRIGFIQNADQSGAYDGQIRRLRLRFDGYVGNPHFLYVLQLSFAPGDVGEIQDGENINIIRDAAVIFKYNKHFSLTFGQTKLPGNRQRIISSGALQLTDRSINNAKFNIDRDFGVQAFYLNEQRDKFSFNIKTAVSTGEGRNFTKNPDNGLAYTAKVEFLPLGAFKKDGAYFEGDLMREEKLKLFISGVYHLNDLARRTQGQLGDYLFSARTFTSYFMDALAKYKGLNLSIAYMSRYCDNPITFDETDPNELVYVYTGFGWDYQASYLFKSKLEVISRFSTLRPFKEIYTLTPKVNQYTLGLTRYIWEHAFKIQLEGTIDRLYYESGDTKTNWYSRLQVEIGI